MPKKFSPLPLLAAAELQDKIDPIELVASHYVHALKIFFYNKVQNENAIVPKSCCVDRAKARVPGGENVLKTS